MAVEQHLELTQIKQNYDLNYSDVKIYWYSTQTDASFNNNTRTAYYFVSKNGGVEEKYAVTYTLPKGRTATIALATIRVPHKADGTGSVKVRTWMQTNISAGLIMLEETLTLTRFPQHAILSVSNGTLGAEQTLVVQKKMTDTLHTITYNCELETGTICTKSNKTEIKWTPPMDLASQAPQGQSVEVNFVVETFDTIGNKRGTSYHYATYGIPSSVFPPLAFSTTDLTQCYGTYGAFVQGKSKLNIDITTYGVYGSWIETCKTEVNGKTYTDHDNVQTDAISGSGQLPIKITVTDSRNRSCMDVAYITVLPYEAPKITAVSAQRCDKDGTVNPGGSHMCVKFSASVSPLNGNNHATYYVGYKKASDAEHTAVEQTALKNKYTVTDATYIVPADPTTSHVLIVTVVDDFGQARTVQNVSSAKKAWSIMKKNGEVVGMAFGKTAEYVNVFDIGWPVKFSGGGDCVVDIGEKDGWTYRKWDSGVAECWKIVEFTTTINTAFGSLYCGNAAARQSYPFTFKEKPVETVTLQSGSTQAFLYAEASGYGVNGTSSSARYNVFRPGAITSSQTFYLSFHVIGKWK